PCLQGYPLLPTPREALPQSCASTKPWSDYGPITVPCCLFNDFVGKSPPLRLLFRRTRIDDNYHQHFLVYVNSRDLHGFLLAWKRQNAREKGYTPSRATTLPGWVARHRLVQNARSRSNSKTASLHPECKRPLPSTPG